MSITYQIEGDMALDRSLERMKSATSKRVLKKALSPNIKKIMDTAKLLVPQPGKIDAKTGKRKRVRSNAGVRQSGPTGKLKKAIRRKVLTVFGGVEHIVFVDRKRAFYGHFLELGTKGSPRGNVKGIKAQPFLTPAYEKHKDKIQKEVRIHIGRGIDLATKG